MPAAQLRRKSYGIFLFRPNNQRITKNKKLPKQEFFVARIGKFYLFTPKHFIRYKDTICIAIEISNIIKPYLYPNPNKVPGNIKDAIPSPMPAPQTGAPIPHICRAIIPRPEAIIPQMECL